MKYLFIFSFIIFTIINVFSENIFVDKVEGFAVNEKATTVFSELIKEELRDRGYGIIDSLNNVDWFLKTKIIKMDNERALIVLNMFENDSLIYQAKRILSKEDKLDIFIKRIIDDLFSYKSLQKQHQYGETLREEEVLSEYEEPFLIKSELDIGIHLGTVEFRSPVDYSYWPVYFSGGITFYKPDYFILVKGESVFQALGLRIGIAKIHSRSLNTMYYGADVGIGIYYGVIDNAPDQQYMGSSISIFGGGLLLRNSTINLKPELRLSTSFRKTSSTIDIIISLNSYITLVF